MTSGSHLSKELYDLIKSIGEAKSKQEEDSIITAEIRSLSEVIKSKKMKEKEYKENLLRAIYIELLGYDASFMHIQAINICQSKSITVKRMAYLCCSLFLNQSSPNTLLLVATIQKDLQSKNTLEVITALNAVCHIVNSTILEAIVEPVSKLLNNPLSLIRKKAVSALLKFSKINTNTPFLSDIEDKMKIALCDKDACVMNAALNYYYEKATATPEKYKFIIPTIVGIQKQIIEHKMPKECDYHRMPAPWIQMRILSILSILGQYDQTASEGMYEVLSMTLKRADDLGLNIGYAILYQCLKTITTIYPNHSMIDLASSVISRFILSDNKNLKYIGITGLASIVAIDPKYALNYQNVVVDCLDDQDESIKKKTIELLARMTNNININAIVDKMLTILRNSSAESSIRKDLVHKIYVLSEKYAPNKEWYIHTINKLFELGGNFITPDLTYSFLKLMNEWEHDSDSATLNVETVNFYLDICKSTMMLNDSLAQVVSWIIGEYGPLVLNQQKCIEAINTLCSIQRFPYSNPITKCWIFNAIAKLHSFIKYVPIQELTDLVEKYKCFSYVELQQRSLEYQKIKSISDLQLHGFLLNDDNVDIELSFLDEYVKDQVSKGKASYDSSKSLTKTLEGLKSELKVKPYVQLGTRKPINNKSQLINEPNQANILNTENVRNVYKKNDEEKKEEKEKEKEKQAQPVLTKKKKEQLKAGSSEKELLGIQLFQGIQEVKEINIDPKTLVPSLDDPPTLPIVQNLLELDAPITTTAKIEQMQANKIIPYVISMEEYKSSWLVYKNEDKFTIGNNEELQSGIQKVEQKCGMHLIKIIGEQAILSGKYNEGKVLLMHIKVGNGLIDCRIKSDYENIQECCTLIKSLLA